MIHICKKKACPKRFSIGKDTDTDALSFICTECKELYYYSESRSRLVFFWIKLLLLFSLIVLVAYIGFSNKEYISQFFEKDVIEQPKSDLAKIDFDITDGILKVGQVFNPKLLTDEISDYNLDLGNGDSYDSTLPRDYRYDKPGKYKIIFTADGLKEEIEVSVSNNQNDLSDPTSKNELDDNNSINSGTSDPQNVTKGKDEEQEFIENPLVYDCPTNKKQFGDLCNDYDPNTENDLIRKDCVCSGTKIKTITWYADQDSDGKGDSKIFKETRIDSKPDDGKNWVKNNSEDKCPERTSNTPNGCPISIEIKNFELEIGNSKSIPKVNFEKLSNDKISWVGSSGLSIISENTLTPIVEGIKLGKQTLNLSISSPVDILSINESVNICVKVNQAYLQNILQPIINYGQYDVNNAIPSTVEAAYKKSLIEINEVFTQQTKVLNNGVMYGNNIQSFIITYIGTQGSYVKGVNIKNLIYNNDKCIVDKINLKIVK